MGRVPLSSFRKVLLGRLNARPPFFLNLLDLEQDGAALLGELGKDGIALSLVSFMPITSPGVPAPYNAFDFMSNILTY